MAIQTHNDTDVGTNGTVWHEAYPELGTGPIPIEPCVSAEYFELERERIYKKTWLNVGRIEQLPRPGAYFVKDLPVCDTSVILTRGRDGVLHAFHNMCSHRGNKIVWDQYGSCQSFTCKFHGWSYSLNGSLRFVPDEERFCDLKKDRLGLTPIRVEMWEGFIFINLDPTPAETLQEHLGELGAGLEGYPFAQLTTCYAWSTELKANWKVLKDAFHEAYHVPFLT